MNTPLRSRLRFVGPLVVVGLMSASQIAFAQEIETGTRPSVSKETGRRYGGVGYFLGGGMIVDHDNVNDGLRSRGLPTVGSATITLGSGGYFRLNRLLIGGEGYVMVERNGNTPSHSTSVTGGMGFFDVGYVVGSFGNLAIFPLLGVGGGGMTYTVGTRGASSFAQALDDPRRGVQLSTGGFMTMLALGVDYHIDMKKGPKEVGGPLFGLRIGYSGQITRGDWDVFGKNVEGGPSARLGGPFVRLVIGGGGMEVE